MRKSNLIVIGFAVAISGSLALGQQKGKKGGGSGDAAKGQEVFQPCSLCHAADSTEKRVGPGLKGLFKRETMANGKKVTEATVRTQIDEGGNGMPSYKDTLSAAEKNDVIAYLKTL